MKTPAESVGITRTNKPNKRRAHVRIDQAFRDRATLQELSTTFRTHASTLMPTPLTAIEHAAQLQALTERRSPTKNRTLFLLLSNGRAPLSKRVRIGE